VATIARPPKPSRRPSTRSTTPTAGLREVPGFARRRRPHGHLQDDEETRRTTSFACWTRPRQIERFLHGRRRFTYMHLACTTAATGSRPPTPPAGQCCLPRGHRGDIYGVSRVDDYVANMSLDYTPTKDWLAKIAYREEYDVIGSDGSFVNTTLAALQDRRADQHHDRDEPTYSNYLERVFTPSSPSSIAASGISPSMRTWTSASTRTTSTGSILRRRLQTALESSRTQAPHRQRFLPGGRPGQLQCKVGSTGPATFLTVRAEVYRKDDQNQFTGPTRYPARQLRRLLCDWLYVHRVQVQRHPQAGTGLTFSTATSPRAGTCRSPRIRRQPACWATAGWATRYPRQGRRPNDQRVGQLDARPVGLPAGQHNVVYNYIQTSYRS